MWTTGSAGESIAKQHFEQATSIVTDELVAELITCGPDADALMKQATGAIDAGVDHRYLHQIGTDQAAFLEAWDTEIGPALRNGFVGAGLSLHADGDTGVNEAFRGVTKEGTRCSCCCGSWR